ncbi:ABC transporter permease [Anaerocellum danielii]|uniref:ABC transporter permease n=1 Tax=Anaerocellum danielii TaxID=1387557 RepID=A0ABZ0TYP4_9FIRM|nr:ABC transporter permease [Caldicellulosiruptor danielii]WPX08588.1 ABC transporter permease [Caldicellulosiruptor danielii]
MNVFIRSVWIGILENIRDRKTIVLLLIFPLLIILILGNALSHFFEKDDIEKVKVLYQKPNLTVYKSTTIVNWFERFLQSEEFRRYFDIEFTHSNDETKKLFLKSNASAYIQIKTKTSSGKDEILFKVTTKQWSPQVSVLNSMIQTFIDYSKLYLVTSSDKIHVQTNEGEKEPFEVKVDALNKGQYPRAIDYYAITMLVMIIIYSIFSAAFVIESDSSQKTSIRLLVCPANLNTVFLGRAIGGFVFVYLQSVLIIVCSKIFFNVNWGWDLSLVLFIVFLYQALIFTMGIFFRMLIKRMEIISVLIYTFATATTFIIGGYVKFFTNSEWLIKLRSILPNYIAQTLLFTVVYDRSNTVYIKHGLFCIAALEVLLLLACIVIIRRRRKWLF